MYQNNKNQNQQIRPELGGESKDSTLSQAYHYYDFEAFFESKQDHLKSGERYYDFEDSSWKIKK